LYTLFNESKIMSMRTINTKIKLLSLVALITISDILLAGDADKKNGLSCFSLNSSGQLSVINCSAPSETTAACVVTSGSYGGVVISCASTGITFTEIE